MSLFATLSDVAVIDCETTGLDPQRDRIISLAVVLADLMKDSQDVKFMEITVDPGVPIPGDATRIHGIRDADVRELDDFGTVAEQLTDFISNRPLVGFNVSFDKQFLNTELKRHNFKSFYRKRSYCVMDALYDAWGYRPSLENALERLSAANPSIMQFTHKIHDPLNDAYATLHLAGIIQRIEANPSATLENAHGDNWEEHPPTQKQLDYIFDLGGDPSLVTTKRQASVEIDRLLYD